MGPGPVAAALALILIATVILATVASVYFLWRGSTGIKKLICLTIVGIAVAMIVLFVCAELFETYDGPHWQH